MLTGKVIIVEDQPNFRKGLIKMIELNQPEWNVVGEASNGQDALPLLDRFKPDLVLTDINMPIMDGINFISLLRNHYPDLLVIILTGYRSFEHAQAAVKLGVLDFLTKPCSEQDVSHVLHKAFLKLSERNPKVEQRSELIERWPLSKSNNTIDKVLKYIEEHYLHACSLTDVASYVQMNPSYLSVLFKKATGETFINYLNRMRMDKAALLLRNTDMKISEIASATGFDEPNYFTNVFRQRYRMSPKEFRKSIS